MEGWNQVQTNLEVESGWLKFYKGDEMMHCLLDVQGSLGKSKALFGDQLAKAFEVGAKGDSTSGDKNPKSKKSNKEPISKNVANLVERRSAVDDVTQGIV